MRARVEAEASRAKQWVDRRRSEALPIDLAMSFYERDREQFASVLGAAIALRLFLFLVPAVTVGVAITLALIGSDGLGSLAQQASITGELADEVQRAADASRSTWVALFVGGLWLSMWAGRSLVVVLATCSGAAWRLDAGARRATVRVTGTVTVLAFGLVLTASITNRLRQEFGLVGAGSSWVLAAVLFGLSWFAVMWALPRGTTDPAAILPGAVVVGLSLAGLQWFMQFYLPSRLDRASAVAGEMGAAVAVLGCMFLVGRVMAASFILNAVVHERLGSISALVFALPFVRRVPERVPKVARWFDLEPGSDAESGQENDSPLTGDARPDSPLQGGSEGAPSRREPS